MSVGFRRARQRRRFLWRIASAFAILAAVCAALLQIYWAGERHGQREAGVLSERMAALEEENRRLAGERVEADAARRLAEAAVAAAEERYARDIPRDARKDLLERIDRRLAAGVSAERLGSVIDVTANDRVCDPPVTRRILLRTPTVTGGGTSVTFGDNQISVSGEGTPARDATNNLEAWFDPEKPVTIRFTQLGGEVIEASGRLPLQHAMVVAGFEYRFTVNPSARGLVAVTGDRCRHP